MDLPAVFLLTSLRRFLCMSRHPVIEKTKLILKCGLQLFESSCHKITVAYAQSL